MSSATLETGKKLPEPAPDYKQAVLKTMKKQSTSAVQETTAKRSLFKAAPKAAFSMLRWAA